MNLKAASKRTQKRWVPKNFRTLKGPNRCYSVADKLGRSNKRLTVVYGFARTNKHCQWDEHAFCVTPNGSIIDPYFMQRFDDWATILYKLGDELSR